MKHKLIPVAIAIILLLLWSCGPTYPEGNTEISYPVPEFSDAVLSYNTIRQELHCEIRVMYDNPIPELNAELILTGFDISTLELILNDSALYGDALIGDNIFSRNISLSRIDSINGSISIQYDILDSGIVIRSYVDTLDIIANLPPVITEITMPDTIVRPVTGTKDLLIYLEVDDPNGVYDVVNAYFQVQSNSTGQWSADFPLNDTGEMGDITAGDGIFSTGLQISSKNSAATNYFRFRVKDTASNFSDWNLDSVVVR
ncbi:MAG: hypothetical protein DRP93_02895 [Candidatus Neomarinimicrobiota bacterium]|nr:MAG: hypothetical protein DRP93_02895 [Candidatus Neomarinimicrobiota bacterium]